MIFQYNVARMRFPWTDERFDTFRDLLPSVHAAAAASPDFLWRHKGEDRPEGYIRHCATDPELMGNLSAWTSRAALKAFTFLDPAHREMMQRRCEWFSKWDDGYYNVMWPQPRPDDSTGAVEVTSLSHARHRLAHLNSYGPTHYAFDWKFEL